MINLIPLAYLNEACFLSLNEDDKKYQFNLEEAQDDLADIIGKEFYEEIESQYDADTLTTDNEALYEGYIKKFLAWQTNLYYQGFANQNHTPTGNREFNDENCSIISDVKQYGFEKNIRNRAVKQKNKMINFLNLEQEKDSTKYPKYEKKCRDDFGFAITSVDKSSDALLKVNKSIISNE